MRKHLKVGNKLAVTGTSIDMIIDALRRPCFSAMPGNKYNIHLRSTGKGGFLRVFLFALFWFLRHGFSVALEPTLGLAFVDQAGFKLTEICLPLPLEYWY